MCVYFLSLILSSLDSKSTFYFFYNSALRYSCMYLRTPQILSPISSSLFFSKYSHFDIQAWPLFFFSSQRTSLAPPVPSAATNVSCCILFLFSSLPFAMSLFLSLSLSVVFSQLQVFLRSFVYTRGCGFSRYRAANGTVLRTRESNNRRVG